MSFGALNSHTLTFTLSSDPVGDGKLYHLMQAPHDLTILSAHAVAGVSQNAGTAVCFTLLNYGTAGSSLQTGGTVVSKLGGTATAERLTADTPAAGSVSATERYISEGEWLVLRENEEGAGFVAGDRFSYIINYVYGKGA